VDKKPSDDDKTECGHDNILLLYLVTLSVEPRQPAAWDDKLDYSNCSCVTIFPPPIYDTFFNFCSTSPR
jgi:hypothetical protein